MPTPASGSPPPPNAPSRSHSFSTCPPEDVGARSPPRSWQPPTTESTAERMDTHPDLPPTEHQSPVPVVAVPSPGEPEGGTEGVAEDNDEQTSASSSSRSTTTSPAPESTTTDRTTPAPGAVELGRRKTSETAQDGPPLPPGPRRKIPKDLRDPDYQELGGPAASDCRNASYWDMGDEELMAPTMGSEYPSLRAINTSPSSFLRPGSKFHGTQQSERQVYDVQVEIKQVDLKESFLCGYLRIQGLTEDHPTLTTYFEGEIIGSKYNFFTNREGWGATNRIDLNHWRKFTAFRPYEKQARKGPVPIRDVAQRENIFMRWKEHFLVPDHRVRTITGASFEGFYYICFNQLEGEVSGIYFHARSEKFQQLELKHVEDRGCFSSLEFR